MIKINAGDLSKALSFINQAYKSKTTNNIMQNVMIDVNNDLAMLTYTNGEQELTYSLKVESKIEDSFTVELKKLKDRVSQYDKDLDISIKYDHEKNKATVKCGRSKITVNGLPSSDYPSSDKTTEFKAITFDGDELKKALASVKPAQAVNDVRYYLNGVYFEFKQDKCSVVATNGNRMHVYTMTIDSDMNESCIVPASAIAPIHKFLDSGKIDVNVSSNHMRISDEESSIQTALVDGRFPDWNRVIPTKNEGQLTFNVADLTSSVKGAMVTANEKYKGIKLNAIGGNVTIQSSAPDGTSSEEVVDVTMVGIDNLEVGVNGALLLDALAPIGGSNVTLHVQDANSAMLIQENGYMAVVMPMRL